MKVKLIICLLLFTVLSFCACQKKDDYLSYQSYPMSITGDFCVNSILCDVTVEMTAMGEAQISFEDPESLEEYRFTVDKKGFWVYYDDISIPLDPKGVGMGVSILPEMFSCNEASLCEINSAKIGGKEYTGYVYSENDCRITVYFESDSKIPSVLRLQSEDSCAVFKVDSISYI